MTPEEEHTLAWIDRLQDWLDGDAAPADGAAFEAHLAGCEICQAQLNEFEGLDEQLQAAVPPIALNETFDRRLFAQIDTIDEAKRTATRQRVEQEFQDNLHALSRSWRRMLAFVIPGAVAGIAVAFALAGILSTEVTHELIASSDSVARNPELVNIALTTLLGAAMGGGVARWLASAAE